MAISLFRHRVSPMTGVAYPGLALNALKGVWVRTSRVFVHYPEESDAVSVAEPLPKTIRQPHIGSVEYRDQTKAEVTADAVVHALGVCFGVIAGPILIAHVAMQGETSTTTAICVYVATLVAMFTCSAIYNLVPNQGPGEWLRRLDHSTIYLKIAGAYTPFAAVSIGGAVGTGLLSVIWGVAAVGVALKILFPRRFDNLSILLYLAMGWAGVMVGGDIASSIEFTPMILVAIAGLLYSTGVIFHLWRALPFQNAIWHVFVLAATAVLYVAMTLQFT